MTELYAKDLCAGYGGVPLLQKVGFSARGGRIMCIIGPNGAGKSTLLKTLSKRLKPVSGTVYIGETELSRTGARALAKRLSVMLTDRGDPELLTAFDVASSGRYPYTNTFGSLTKKDREETVRALSAFDALSLSDRLFSELSDGQKQRVMLARALCQTPRVLLLDEPTAFLDVRFKAETVRVLRKEARERNMCVIMTLHDADLAFKCADELLCIDGEGKIYLGAPEDIAEKNVLEKLYGLPRGAFDPFYGGVELPAPEGEPRFFVVSGGGAGVPYFRMLARADAPFAAGVLLANDTELKVASALASRLICAEGFSPAGEKEYEKAAKTMLSCKFVIDAGARGELFAVNARLVSLAKEKGMRVLCGRDEVREVL